MTKNLKAIGVRLECMSLTMKGVVEHLATYNIPDNQKRLICRC